MVRGRSRRSPDESGVVRSVAENYIPPIIAEVIARVTKFKAGMDEAKAAAASAARDINVSTDKIQGSTERAAEKSGAAWKAQGAAAKDAARATAASADEQAAAADRTVAAHARVQRSSGLASKELAGIATAGKYASLGLAAVGIGAVKLASDYQGATTRIAANAQISVDAAKKITDAFLSTAGSTIYSAQQIATAYGQVAGQLGVTEGHALNAADALRFMKTSMDLAEASGTDLTSSTSALSTVMRAFHLSIGDAAGATDVLFNVSRETQVPLETLAAQFAKLHSRLGDLAPNLKDVGTLMSFPSIQAAGSRGLLAVNSGLNTLLGNSKKVDDLLQSMNIHLYDQQGNFVGLRSVIQQLSPVLADMNQKQQIAVEQTLVGKSNMQLLGQVLTSNVGAWDQYSAAVGRANSAHDAAKKQAQTFQHQVDQLKATLLDLATKLGQILVPALQSVAGMISTVVNWFDRHTTAAKILAGVIAGLLTTAIVVFTTSKLVALVNGVKGTLGAFQSLAGFLTGGFSSSVDTASGKVTGMANNVGTQMTRTSTTLAAAEGTIGAETKTIGGEFNVIGASANANATAVGAAMTKTEGELTKAAPVLAAEGKADGAAFSAGFLSSIATLGAGALAILGVGAYQYGKQAGQAFNPSVGTPATVPSSVHTQAQFAKWIESQGFSSTIANQMAAQWASQQKPGSAANSVVTLPPAPGGGPPGTRISAASGSQASFVTGLLRALGAPVTAANVSAVTAWTNAEGVWGKTGGSVGNNPLGVTMAYGQPITGFFNNLPGGGHVLDFGSPASGIAATAAFIKARTPNILAALMSGNISPAGLEQAANASGWAGAGGYPGVWGPATPSGSVNVTASGGSSNPLAAFNNALAALAGANEVNRQSHPASRSAAAAARRAAAAAQRQAGSNMLTFLNNFAHENTQAIAGMGGIQASQMPGYGGDTQLVKAITAIHDQAMKKVVANEIANGNQNTKSVGNQLLAMSKSLSDFAKAVTATAVAAYKHIITTMDNLAKKYSTVSSGLGTLYGVTGALGLTDARAGVTAQEIPLVGSNFQNPGQMLAYLGAVSQGLEAGGGASSQANYAGWAKAFGGTGSQLGTYFTNLASGKLKPADVTSTLGQVYSLIGSIVNLETSLSQNTAATTANTTATVDNTTVTNAATGPASSPGPTINVYTNDLATGQAFASQLYLALRPILVSPNA